MLTLDKLKPGECALVHSCDGNGAVFQRLCELGFVEGAPLRLVRRAPLGDPLEVKVHDFHLSLRRTEARMVNVKPLEVTEGVS